MNVATLNRLQPNKKKQLGTVGLKLFFTLANQWGLSQEEQLSLLGLTSRTTLHNWKVRLEQGEELKLSLDTLERLSLIAGIRKGVEILYGPERWNDYMRSSNRAFGDQSPLDRMLMGKMGNLYEVRRYLDASRGAQFG